MVRLNLPNMHYEPAERVAVYAAAVRGLTSLEPDPGKRLKYVDFIDTYSALDDTERACYERDYPSEAQTVTSFYQRCREEGRQPGEVVALMRVMQHKFGDIPEPARRRIETADPETLLEWLDRALVAQRIDEVIH